MDFIDTEKPSAKDSFITPEAITTPEVKEEVATNNAMMGAALVNDPEAVSQIKSEYTTLGSSPTVDEVLKREDEGAYRKVVEDTLGKTTDPVEIEATIRAYSSTREKAKNVKVNYVEKIQSLSLGNKKAPVVTDPIAYLRLKGHQQLAIDAVEDWKKRKEEGTIPKGLINPIEMIAERARRDSTKKDILEGEKPFSSGFIEGFEAVGETLIPFVTSGTSSAVNANSKVPVSPAWLLLGENKMLLRKYIQEGKTPEEQKARFDEVARSIKQYGSFNDNSLIKMDLADVLDNDYSTAHRVFDDAMSLIPGALAIRGLYRTVANSLLGGSVKSESILNVTSDINPQAAQAISNKSSENGEEGARAVSGGASQEDVYRWESMPKIDKEDTDLLDGAPKSVVDEYESLKKAGEDIYKESAGVVGRGLTKEEKEAEVQRISKEVDLDELHLNPGMSKVIPEEDGVKVEAFYTNKDGRGFSRADIAFNTLKQQGADLGIDNDNISLYFRDNGAWRKLTPEEVKQAVKSKMEGEFGVSFKDDFEYTNKSVAGYSPEDFKISENKFVNKLGQAARWAFDSVNKFSDKITRPMNRAYDSGSAVEAHLLKLVKKSLGSLPMASKKKVTNVLAKGNEAGEVFSYKQLKEQGLNDREIKAVFSAYKYWDTIYAINNRGIARELSNKGYHVLNNKETGDTLFYKPFKTPKGGHYYDASTGKAVKLSDSDASKLVEEGKEFGNLRHPLIIDGKKVDKVLITRGEGVTARRVRLDDMVLNYRKGYFPRSYTGDYFIEKTVKVEGEDGKIIEHTEVVAVGSSVKKVEDYVSKMNAESNGEALYTVRKSKELNAKLSGNTEPLSQYEKGRSIEKHRGKHLQGVDDLDESGLARIEHPIQTIVRSAATTGNYATTKAVIENMKANWMKTFGEYSKTPGVFPKTLSDMKLGKDVSKTEYVQAKDLAKYIHTLEAAYDKSMTDLVWKRVLQPIAEMLDKAGLEGLGSITRKVRDANPIRAAKTVTFNMFIAAAPIRQYILQSAQLTQYLPLTLKYGANPVLLVADMWRVNSLASVYKEKGFSKALKAVSLSSHLDAKEWASIARGYYRSGLGETVDKNSLRDGAVGYIGEEVTHNKAAAFALGIKNILALPLRTSKRVGFDAGESNNLVGAFLVATERFKSQNGIKAWSEISDKQWEEIADVARKISWNMNPTAKFGYQYGDLSLITQFMQVMHKAVLYQVSGNKVLTRAERGRLFASNLAILGASGMGIGGVLDSVRNGDEAVEEAVDVLQDGLATPLVNYLGDLYYDEDSGRDSKVAVGTELSPYTGWNETVMNFLDGVVSGETDVYKLAPFFMASKRLAKAFHETAYILEGKLPEEMSAEDQAQSLLLAVTSPFSGVNHFLQYSAAKRLGVLVSSTGSETVEATRFEALSKLGGFNTEFEEKYFGLIKDERKHKKAIEDSADEWYGYVKKQAMLYSNSDNPVDQKKYNALLFVPTTLTPQEQQIFYSRVKLMNKYDSQSGEDSLVKLVLKGLNRNTIDKDTAQKMIGILPDQDAREAMQKLFDIKFEE